MKIKNLIAITILCICIFMCLPAMAANLTIITPHKIVDLIGGSSTPPVAYKGEYVDLSKVVGWSGSIAFWNSGYPSADQKPDLIIDASTFQHNFWIDPAKFKIGMWYKWDGTYEDSSNPEAFEVKDGVRPIPVPTESTANFTGITPIVTAVPYLSADNHILLARGDELEYPVWNPDYKKGYLWLFGKTESILGYEMNQPSIGNHTFVFPFGEEMTQGLEVGWYSGYMQFCTKRPDVFYNESHNDLDTPYDDAKVPDVNLAGLTPDRIKSEFEKLESNSEYTDDKLVNITLEIKDPIIMFTDYYEVDDSIIVQGKSTLSAGTNISFIVDPSRYSAGYSTSSHTVISTLKGDIDEPRQFSVTIPVDWSQMAIGRHVVVGTIDKLKMHLTQDKQFDVTTAWVNPTPTMRSEKVIVEDGGWHRVNTSTVVGTDQTPSVIYVNATPQIIYVYVTATPAPTSNATITKIPTTALPANVRTTTPPEETPISPMVAIGGLVIIAAYVVIKKE